MGSLYRLITILALAVAAAGTAPAGPPTLREIREMVEKGRPREALKRLDAHLKDHGKDVEARFMKAIVLLGLNRTNEAVAMFVALTADYPGLPEPHNNLGVLYAQRGELEKSREAFEAAVAADPKYAPARENLGDIYAMLAHRAYSRALDLDLENPQTARKKLSHIDRAITTVGPAGTGAAVTAGAQAARGPIEPASVATSASVPALGPAARPVDETPAVLNDIKRWAASWSAKNVASYLAAYAEDFEPPGNLSRAEWEKQRRARLLQPWRVRVTVDNVRVVTVDATTRRAFFRQTYVSDVYTSRVKKALLLKKTARGWKILKEETLK